MVINTLMAIIIGIWKLVGNVLSLSPMSIVGTIIYACVSATIYFYYLAIATKYKNTNNQKGAADERAAFGNGSQSTGASVGMRQYY